MKHTLRTISTTFLLFLLCHLAYSQQYVIPVVFHILHTEVNGSNISDAQVEDAIRILNEDYNKRNADTAQVVAAFSNNIADMEIEFRLAKLDPNGNCTNGIERIYTYQTYQGQSNEAKINQWPPQKYLNIWVFDKMQGGVGGFAATPFNYIAAYDGVTTLNDYVGSIGTSNAVRSRTLTYEIGQYLGLLNLEGSDGFDCGEDSVNDTPTTSYIDFCNTNMLSCDGVTPSNVQNFMCYSYCSRMFTNGQKARVHNILNNYPVRSNLHSPANLAATGTSNNNPGICPPTAAFYTTRPYACVGDSVKFVDASYNGKVNSRQWQFTNASISSSADSVVFVTFSNSGWQTVTLNVTNQYGLSTTTRQSVYISTAQNIPVPYYTSFDDENDFNQNWAVVNTDNDQPRFRHTTSGGHTGSNAVLLNNIASMVIGNMDELYTPVFDCSTLTNTDALLNVWISYATRDTNTLREAVDSLVIYATKNCGKTWNKIYNATGNNLVNAGYVQGTHIPNGNAYWKKIAVPLSGTGNGNLRVAGVSFKIQVYGSPKSNNLYIDDFSIGTEPATAISELNELSGITISPNPYKEVLHLQHIPEGSYSVAVINVTGQSIQQQQNLAIDNTGNLQLNMAGQVAGVYFVNLSNRHSNITLRAVKQ